MATNKTDQPLLTFNGFHPTEDDDAPRLRELVEHLTTTKEREALRIEVSIRLDGTPRIVFTSSCEGREAAFADMLAPTIIESLNAFYAYLMAVRAANEEGGDE